MTTIVLTSEELARMHQRVRLLELLEDPDVLEAFARNRDQDG